MKAVGGHGKIKIIGRQAPKILASRVAGSSVTLRNFVFFFLVRQEETQPADSPLFFYQNILICETSTHDLTDFVAVHNSYNGYMNLWKAIDAKTVFLAEFKKAPCSNF